MRINHLGNISVDQKIIRPINGDFNDREHRLVASTTLIQDGVLMSRPCGYYNELSV
jgi:hypothetical protein